MIDYRSICNNVVELACEVGEFLADERRKMHGLVTTESKGLHDYVTQFDKKSERRIVTRLQQLLPDGGFIAEEGTASSSGKERYGQHQAGAVTGLSRDGFRVRIEPNILRKAAYAYENCHPGKHRYRFAPERLWRTSHPARQR